MTTERKFSLRKAPTQRSAESVRITLATAKARFVSSSADGMSMRKLAVAFLTRAIDAAVKRSPYFSHGHGTPCIDDFEGSGNGFRADESARITARDVTKASVSMASAPSFAGQEALLGL